MQSEGLGSQPSQSLISNKYGKEICGATIEEKDTAPLPREGGLSG